VAKEVGTVARIEDLRASMTAYIRNISEWRRGRYNDDLRDPRHLRSADALGEFAVFIDELPIDDLRLGRLAHLAADGEEFAPGQQTAYEIGRYHFHDETMTPDGFLSFLVTVAERDAGEQGRFGGLQAPGDDPWR
jgi:hypothetical protein